MKFHKLIVITLSGVSLIGLSGCQTTSSSQLLKADQSQVQTRNIQTRAFDATDKNKTLRTVISTLQDLGFVVDKADEVLGSVSATKLDGV